MSSSDKEKTMTTLISTLQLIALVVGFGSVALKLGQRDHAVETLEYSVQDLKQITTDLVKTQLTNMATDRVQDERIDQLWNRLEQLGQ